MRGDSFSCAFLGELDAGDFEGCQTDGSLRPESVEQSRGDLSRSTDRRIDQEAGVQERLNRKTVWIFQREVEASASPVVKKRCSAFGRCRDLLFYDIAQEPAVAKSTNRIEAHVGFTQTSPGGVSSA